MDFYYFANKLNALKFQKGSTFEFIKILGLLVSGGTVAYFFPDFGLVIFSLIFIILINRIIEPKRLHVVWTHNPDAPFYKRYSLQVLKLPNHVFPNMLCLILLLLYFIGLFLVGIQTEFVLEHASILSLFLYAYWIFIGVAIVTAFNYLYVSLKNFYLVPVILAVFAAKFAAAVGYEDYTSWMAVYGYLVYITTTLSRFILRNRTAIISTMVVFLLINVILAWFIDVFFHQEDYYLYAISLLFPAAVFRLVWRLEEKAHVPCPSCKGWGKVLGRKTITQKNKEQTAQKQDNYTTLKCPTCKGKTWIYGKGVFQD